MAGLSRFWAARPGREDPYFFPAVILSKAKNFQCPFFAGANCEQP
jgi:hypothetical protein